MATSCFNFHPLIFHNSLLTEAPDQIMTVSRPVSCFLFGSSCGFGGGVTGIRTPPPNPSTHTPSTNGFSNGRAPRLAVDPNLAPTVEAWDLGLVFDPVHWVEGWRLVGALGLAPVHPDSSACLEDLCRAWRQRLSLIHI